MRPPSWMMRLLPPLPVTFPKVELFIAVDGVPRLVRLKTLVASPRIWNLNPSYKVKVLKIEESMSRYPGTSSCAGRVFPSKPSGPTPGQVVVVPEIVDPGTQ